MNDALLIKQLYHGINKALSTGTSIKNIHNPRKVSWGGG